LSYIIAYFTYLSSRLVLSVQRLLV